MRNFITVQQELQEKREELKYIISIPESEACNEFNVDYKYEIIELVQEWIESLEWELELVRPLNYDAA